MGTPMLPIEAHAPHLVRFLTERRAFPGPRFSYSPPNFVIQAALASFGLVMLALDHIAIAAGAFLLMGCAFTLLAFHKERTMSAAERRHRSALAVRERLRGMLTLRRLHRELDPGLLITVDEGCRRYLLARGHAAKMRHPLLAQADAAAVTAMDDLLLDLGVNLPERPSPRSFADSVSDGLGPTPFGRGVARFLGASGPPAPDFDALRRMRPHVEALAALADEVERTLPSLARDLSIPGEPPISQTLDALREHREAGEQLERELRLGG